MTLSRDYIDFLAENGFLMGDWRRRLDFELGLLPPSPVKVVDVGCGDGVLLGAVKFLFPDCVCVGIDDYGDHNAYSEIRKVNSRIGVEYLSVDASLASHGQLTYTLQDSSVILALNTIEHWHRSPRRFLEQSVFSLRPEGVLILAAPNNSNLKKRLLAALGCTQWSPFDDWFNRSDIVFRGHVREPNISDLFAIGKQLRCVTRVYGKNFIGLYHPSRLVRGVTRIIDGFISPFPSICSDLYAVFRPESTV